MRWCWATRSASCSTSSPPASTKKAHAKVALKRLRLAGVTPIGAVMTKVDLRDGMYGYESAYYYYGSTNEVAALPRA